MPGKDGRSKYEHYKIAKNAGAKVPELESLVTIPHFQYIIDIWQDLHVQRPSGYSVQPLSNSFILGNCLTKLTSFELRLIREVDKAYMKVINGRSSDTSN